MRGGAHGKTTEPVSAAVPSCPAWGWQEAGVEECLTWLARAYRPFGPKGDSCGGVSSVPLGNQAKSEVFSC